MLEPWALKEKWLKKKLAWWCYQKRDLLKSRALHATAYSEARQFSVLGLNSPVFCLANGVNVPTSSTLRATNDDALYISRLPVKRALFLGRIHPKKGLPMLMRAWARVLPRDWEMLVVGPGDPAYIGQLKLLASSLKIQRYWSFREAVDDSEKWQLFHSASLFVLPTHSENFGIVVAEALTAGVPVITTREAPWRGLVEQGCGWWVDASVDGLAAALGEAENAGERQLHEMGAMGKEWAVKEFSWPQIAGSMLREYRSLLAE